MHWCYAFLDELEKIASGRPRLPGQGSGHEFGITKNAASVSELVEGMKRIKPIYTTAPDFGVSLATKAQAKRALQGQKPLSFFQRLLSRIRPLRSDRADEVIDTLKAQGVPDSPGQIYVGSSSPYLLGHDKKSLATMASATMHEAAERAVPPKQMSGLFVGGPSMHRGPDVLMKEHNMLERMSGLGSEETVNALRNLRSETGETSKLRNFAMGELGPQAGGFFSKGQKIPKAMRKQLSQRAAKKFPL